MATRCIKHIKINSLKKRVWKVFSEYIRLRDCLKTTGCASRGRCITCDKVFSFKDLQAGHLIAGRHNASLFSELGVNAQCSGCNNYLRGNPHEYMRKIVKMYGEKVAVELEQEAKKNKKFTVDELLNLEQELKEKIKEMKR